MLQDDDRAKPAPEPVPPERGRAARALASLATLQKVIDSTEDLVFCVDARTRTLLAFNAAFAAHFRGTEARIATGAGVADVVPAEEYRQFWTGLFDRALAHGPCAADYKSFHGDRRFSLNVDVLRDADGVFGVSVFARDVTESVRARQVEEALRQRNQYIETVLEQAPIGFAVHTIDDGVGRFVSARYDEIYGCEKGSIVSHLTFFETVWPRDPELRETIKARVLADMASGDPARMRWEDIPVPLANGETRYVTAMNIPLFDQNLMVSTVQDVTPRVRAEERLRESELRFRQVAESVSDFVWEVDPAGLYTYTSPSVARILGYEPEDLVGKLHFFDLIAPEEREARRAAAFEIIASRDSFRAFAKTVTTRQGGVVHLEASGLPILDDSGRLVGYRGADTDVTDRRRAEEFLRQSYVQVENDRERLRAERDYLRHANEPDSGIVGDSPALTAVMEQADRVAPTGSPVLLLGETGTGKDVVARRIHERSPLRDRMLVTVNCAALPAGLVESELFGYERGAFTGALQRTQGRFELAHGGTIFLDEVGELPIETQPKLLRVLQSGEFERLGSNRTLRVDVRVIAATNRDLEAAVKDGRFRADLFYRLSVFPLRLPPLRERVWDIPLLVWHFVQQKQADLGKSIRVVSADAMRRLQAYPWPGNVRELENVVERALIMSTGPQLAVPDLGRAAPGSGDAADETLEDVERAHILRVVEACGWKLAGPGNAAERLGLNRSTLQFRMKKLGIERPPSPRSSSASAGRRERTGPAAPGRSTLRLDPDGGRVRSGDE